MANLPLRSMTGFARARRPLGDGELVVSVKTLNHRSLDVHVHAPSAADAFEIDHWNILQASSLITRCSLAIAGWY